MTSFLGKCFLFSVLTCTSSSKIFQFYLLKHGTQDVKYCISTSLSSGTSYYIDFQSFSEIGGGINAAGTCANRNAADYDGLSFEQFWKFPVNPKTLKMVNAEERMAYPQSSWDLSATDCNVVKYKRTMTWTVW